MCNSGVRAHIKQANNVGMVTIAHKDLDFLGWIAFAFLNHLN